jgi:hypothetical protein
MADRKLRVTFEFNQADLDKAVKGLEKAGVSAKVLEKNLEGVGEESNKAFDQASKGINQLVTGVKAFLGLEVIKMFKDAAIEASKLAAAGEGIRSAFSKFGGTAADMRRLSEAVEGTVANIDLMRLSINAMQKGVRMNELESVLKFVNKQADATGASLEQLADIAINAIGKQSTKGLQQLGLNIQNIEKRGKEIGFMPSLLEEMAAKSIKLEGVTSKAGQAYGQLAANQKNLQEAFGNLVNSSGFIKMQSFLSTGVQGLANLLGEQNSALLQARTKVGLAQLVIADNPEASAKVKESNAKFLKEAMEELAVLERQEADRLRKIKFEQDKIALQAKLEEDAELTKKFEQDQAELRKEQGIKAAKERGEAEAKAYQEAIIAQNNKTANQATLDAFEASKAGTISDVLSGIGDKTRKNIRTTQDVGFDVDSQEQKVKRTFEDIPDATNKAVIDMQQMFGITTQIVNAFNSLNDGEKKDGKGIFKTILATLGGILTMFPGTAPIGLGVSMLGGFFNQGGKVGQPVGPNQDTILAGLTLGEYVVKRESTKRSGLLLDAINAGEIDDKFLLKLNQAPVIVNVDQAKVVEAINNMPQVDFYKNGSVLFEVRREAAGRRERRRKVTML